MLIRLRRDGDKWLSLAGVGKHFQGRKFKVKIVKNAIYTSK